MLLSPPGKFEVETKVLLAELLWLSHFLLWKKIAWAGKKINVDYGIVCEIVF